MRKHRRTALLVALAIVIFGQQTYGVEEKPMGQKRNVILGLRKVTWDDVERQLEKSNLDLESFRTEIWAYNPFWVKRGYPEYAMPIVARHPHPRK